METKTNTKTGGEAAVRPCPLLFPSLTVTARAEAAFEAIRARVYADTYLPKGYRRRRPRPFQGVVRHVSAYGEARGFDSAPRDKAGEEGEGNAEDGFELFLRSPLERLDTLTGEVTAYATGERAAMYNHRRPELLYKQMLRGCRANRYVFTQPGGETDEIQPNTKDDGKQD